MIICCDNGSTLKGHSTFGRIVGFPRNQPSDGVLPALGIEVVLMYLTAGHGSGVHDSSGKQLRRLLDAATRFNKVSPWSYHQCYEYCRKHMAEPDSHHQHDGT